MRRPMTTLLCAGALLMTAVACSDDDDEPGASEETSSTTTSTTAPEPEGPKDIREFDIDDGLEPGTYFIDPDDDPSTSLTATYEVGEGWSGWVGAAKFNDTGHTALSITTVDNVVTEACDDPAPQDPAVGPSVDDLAIALSELTPFELTEPPTDVTLLGYQGKHLKITVPDLEVTGSGDTAEYADCVDGNLFSWIDSGGEPFFGYNAEPGRYDEYWILDVDGTRLVISINSSPAMPPEDLTEVQAIIDSIQFEA